MMRIGVKQKVPTVELFHAERMLSINGQIVELEFSKFLSINLQHGETKSVRVMKRLNYREPN